MWNIFLTIFLTVSVPGSRLLDSLGKCQIFRGDLGVNYPLGRWKNLPGMTRKPSKLKINIYVIDPNKQKWNIGLVMKASLRNDNRTQYTNHHRWIMQLKIKFTQISRNDVLTVIKTHKVTIIRNEKRAGNNQHLHAFSITAYYWRI